MYKEFGKDPAASAKGFGGPQQKSFGQSFALPKGYVSADPKLWQILAQLVMKMGRRLRGAGFTASGMGISLLFRDYTHWHTQEKLTTSVFADCDFYDRFRGMLIGAPPDHPVRILAVYCYALESDIYAQLSLLPEENKKRNVAIALDRVQERFGDFVVAPGRMLGMGQWVLDRIAFGKAML